MKTVLLLVILCTLMQSGTAMATSLENEHKTANEYTQDYGSIKNSTLLSKKTFRLSPALQSSPEMQIELSSEFTLIQPKPKHSLEISPLSPIFRIYAIQYGYEFRDRNVLQIGFAYANIKYDFGQSHAPTLILGYRHYFYDKWHLEYQLWPAYNAFLSNENNLYYRGFELWNEARVGYTFDFRIADRPFFISAQTLFGFGLVRGNKPDAFIRFGEPGWFFVAPVFFTGYRF